MRFGIFNKFGAQNSVPVFESFCQGLDRLGIKYQYHNEDADIAVIWSVLWNGRMSSNQMVWNTFQQTGRNVIVLEVGSIRRGDTWKVGLNGTWLGCYKVHSLDYNRPSMLGMHVKDWNHSGQHIVIACQRSDSQQWQGLPPTDKWLSNTLTLLKNYSDRRIVIRPHPRQKIKIKDEVKIDIPRKISNTYDDFDFLRVLQQAWCVINWNSGVGPQSVIQGIPAFVGPNSLAAPVAVQDFSLIENPSRPDRQQWLVEYSHTEWTIDEIASGYPIQRILDIL